jgi:hypothetical protein
MIGLVEIDKMIKKILQRAIDNGFNLNNWEYKNILLTLNDNNKYELDAFISLLIFSHDFAKSFFNKVEIQYILVCQNCNLTYNYFDEEKIGFKNNVYCTQCGSILSKEEDYRNEEWRQQIMMLAKCEDRIKYLTEYLEKNEKI